MEFQHIIAKVFVEGELSFDPSSFIEVFHRWIQEDRMPELLIDVADYCHVPDGPGVLLVAHEADYSMDHTDGRWGMRYNRKAMSGGSSNEDRFTQALSAALNACGVLEETFAEKGLRFSRTEFEILVNDRAMAPNTPEVVRTFQSEVSQWLDRALGETQPKLRGHPDARRVVGTVVKMARPVDLAHLLKLVKVSPRANT